MDHVGHKYQTIEFKENICDICMQKQLQKNKTDDSISFILHIFAPKFVIINTEPL